MADPMSFTVVLGLTGLTPPQVVERGRSHVDALTGNAVYTTPVPPLATITSACDALEAADLKVLQNGGKLDYLARNERNKELRALIKELSGYVQAVSGGDKEKIASAAFGTRKLPEPVGDMNAAGDVRARITPMIGELDVRWNGVRGRMIYILEICDGDPLVPANWKLQAMQSKNFLTVKGLESGKPYSFRVVAVGAAGPGPASDPATAKPL
jgi:hypothetical protein